MQNSATDEKNTGEAEEILRRKLIFRAWHRGTKEMDLMMGRFADRHLQGMNRAQLQLFEGLMHENDPDLYNWLTGREEMPARCQNEVTALMVALFSKS